MFPYFSRCHQGCIQFRRSQVLLPPQVRPGRHRHEFGDPFSGLSGSAAFVPREEAGFPAVGILALDRWTCRFLGVFVNLGDDGHEQVITLIYRSFGFL